MLSPPLTIYEYELLSLTHCASCNALFLNTAYVISKKDDHDHVVCVCVQIWLWVAVITAGRQLCCDNQNDVTEKCPAERGHS